MSGQLINPATNKPFVKVAPSSQIMNLRHQIIHTLRAKYDSAQTTSQNEQHWLMSDNLSPNAAHDLPVRRKLRTRSRYETANNGYLKGIVLSLANDFVGSGPKLKITDKRFNEGQRLTIERRWMQRAKKIKLRRKLWQIRYAKCESGEGFLFKINNRRLRHPVKADQNVIECDQVTHFDVNNLLQKKQNEIDGLRFDTVTGQPIQYHLLNQHPGETLLTSLRPLDGKWINAEHVVHWFRRDRNALRGVPETTSTLSLWALLRRYTLAVVQNAEIAADFTILLKSLQPAATNPFSLSGTGEPIETNADNWFQSFPVDTGMMTVVPDGYDLDQLDPRQPVMHYDVFANALVQEAARPLLTPKNHALGSSGDFNMASANLDRQLYRESIDMERHSCDEDVLDVDLEDWWFEAVRVTGYFQDEVGSMAVSSVVNKFQDLREEPPEHTYHWDQVAEHVDPVKVAQAVDILHRGRHISDTDVQENRFNRPVEEHYENLRNQEEFRKEQEISLFQEEKAEFPGSDEGED